MAVTEDYDACRTYWAKWSKKFTPRKIVSCSGNSIQVAILKDMFLVAEVINWGIERWSLDYPCQTTADVIVVCNVFHYSPNPSLWLKNCLASCKQLWLQDLFSRPRGPQGKEFSITDTGDCVRYGYGGIATSNTYDVFDLVTLKDRILDYSVYDAGSFREGKAMINFAACIKGDL